MVSNRKRQLEEIEEEESEQEVRLAEKDLSALFDLEDDFWIEKIVEERA